MGGQQGSRGYLYQGIVSIFSACTENDWNHISVEYTTDNDKVDIALLSDTNNVLKAIQVKSSVNLFTKGDIMTWITDIMNDVSAKEYQLILIGNCQEQANTLIKSIEKFSSNTLDKESQECLGSFYRQISGKNVRVLLLPFDEDHLMGVIRDSLNRFISCQGYTIDYTSLEEICYALLSLHMFLGTKANIISKVDYEKRITDWIISSSNGAMKKSGNYSELKIKISHQSDEVLTDRGCSILFSNLKSLLQYRNSILHDGETLIQQIDSIKLPAFKQLNEIKPIDTEKIQRYTKGDITNFNFDDFPKYKSSELTENEKEITVDSIKKYWDVDVLANFFYVGNLTESTLFLPFTGQTDFNGTDTEKLKDTLLHDLKWKILILEYIDYVVDILKNVHLLPLCITNASNISDKNITVSFSTHNEGFRLFSLTSEITGESRELLNVLADTLIEEKIIENTLSIKPSANIDLEPKEWTTPAPFFMPNLIGGRRRYDFDDLVSEWETYQAEEGADGIISYEISSLRPGETKWLSPYMIIIPTAETFSLEYIILSESSGSKISSAINIDTNFTPENKCNLLGQDNF